MTKKFECKNCKKHFEANDSCEVRCPHCQSDNVEIASFRLSPKVWKAVAVIAILAAIVAAIVLMTGKTGDTENTQELVMEVSDSDSSIVLPDDVDITIPPTIELADDLAFEDKGYAFSVKVKNRPATPTYVAVLDRFDNTKVIQKSDNGQFRDVPPSEDDGGYYTIALKDAATDTIICFIDKSGFIKQAVVDTRMTVAELQALLDKRDNSLLGIGENDYLAPNCKLKFTGLPADAVNIPTILSEVFEKIDNEVWASVRVTALDYDDKNRIATITLNVTANDNVF